MEKVIINPDTREKLRNLNSWLEFCDENGHVLGYFTPAPKQPLECPLSEDELRQRLEESDRCTTQEVLEHWENLR